MLEVCGFWAGGGEVEAEEDGEGDESGPRERPKVMMWRQ